MLIWNLTPNILSVYLVSCGVTGQNYNRTGNKFFEQKTEEKIWTKYRNEYFQDFSSEAIIVISYTCIVFVLGVRYQIKTYDSLAPSRPRPIFRYSGLPN